MQNTEDETWFISVLYNKYGGLNIVEYRSRNITEKQIAHHDHWSIRSQVQLKKGDGKSTWSKG